MPTKTKYRSRFARVWQVFAWWGCFAALLPAQITTRTDEVGQTLNRWDAAGTAAGVRAIFYENRDNGHSVFPAATYPRVPVWQVPEDEKTTGKSTGPAMQVRSQAVFGNCSMAAPADKGGSLPRIYLLNQNGFEFLTNQYLHNNVFFYPEHQDYDPGYNGVGGWGDLYPANTPFTVISQGSSFTDIPFIQAFFSTAAAFSPDVQATLIRTRLLAPTLQSIFRHCNTMVESDADYFTGKAHPPVFDGARINELKMIQMAHDMTVRSIPPVALLDVLEESDAKPGIDFFETDLIQNEVLGTTPLAIARIFRATALQRKVKISARRSADITKQPIDIRWALLQGDPEKVKIALSEDGVEATITVDWQPPAMTATGIASHRIDIGVFAGDSFGWSAPSMITFYLLPNESRIYKKDGTLEEICYEAGNPDLGVPPLTDMRWLFLAQKIKTPKRHLGTELLASKLPESALKQLEALSISLSPAHASWRTLSGDPKQKAAADTALSELQTKLRTALEEPCGAGSLKLWATVKAALEVLASDPELYLSRQPAVDQLTGESSKPTAVADLEAARRTLLNLMVAQTSPKGDLSLLRPVKFLSEGDRYHLRQFHLTVLSQVLFSSFLDRSTAPAFVDSRLSVPKAWRDVYQYTEDGTLQGWTRLTNGRSYSFDRSGKLLPGSGASAEPVEVKYVIDPQGRLVFLPK